MKTLEYNSDGSIKPIDSTSRGARIKVAREVTVPLAFLDKLVCSTNK